jgi:hypothetical protein
VEGVSGVVGLQELRTSYARFSERRKLRDGEDRFRDVYVPLDSSGAPHDEDSFMHHSDVSDVDETQRAII